MRNKTAPLLSIVALGTMFGVTVSWIHPSLMADSWSLFYPSSSAESDMAQAQTAGPQAPRSTEESAVIDVYKRTNAAVVNVSTQATSYDLFGPVYQQGSGSGVIIDPKRGLVVTNFHVIAGAEKVMLTFASSESTSAEVIGQDPDNDLALMRIVNPPKNIVGVELGASSSLEVGQRVLAIGNPFGLQRTLSTGIVSSLGRSIRSENGRVIEDVIQIDAAINPGNSGGPLLDTAGRLVGINTAILSRVGESAGIGFAIPADLIKTSLPQLIKYGRVLRPKIGVILADTELGPALQYVQPDSPADRAGLVGAQRKFRQGNVVVVGSDYEAADFIISVNGNEVKTKSDVFDIIGKVSEPEELTFIVRKGYRGNDTRVVKVVPEMR